MASSSASPIIDVFCENVTEIDWQIHDLWISGSTVSEAVSALRESGILADYPGVTTDLLVSDVNDHYRLFGRLEQLLLTVGNLSEQIVYQMDDQQKSEFIEKYYRLDSVLCR